MCTGKVHKWSESHTAKAIELYNSGLTMTQVANRLGFGFSTVQRHLKQSGIELRSRGPYRKTGTERTKDALDVRILELHKQGLSDYEIAPLVGVSRFVVNYHLNKMGIHRGKGVSTERNRRKGANASHAKYVDRFSTVSDKVTYISGNHLASLVRCNRCGSEFTWTPTTWDAIEPCPTCRKQKRESEQQQLKYEQEQQNIAAREYRLSVPHICKECGEPFYTVYDEATYCCSSCRKRAKAERRKQHGSRNCSYRHRMRIVKTSETYDPSVTLSAVYKRFKGRCCACGRKVYRTKEYSPNRATLDHIIALANNGTHTWDNVQLLCSECNSNKRDTGQMRLAI